MKSVLPDNRLKVKLDGETQDVLFEQPVHSVEFPDGTCRRVHFPNNNFFIGMLFGAITTMLLAWFYFSLANLHICDMDEHRVMSAESARRLQDQGITWDVDLRRWIKSDSPSVTKLSPKLPNQDK